MKNNGTLKLILAIIGCGVYGISKKPAAPPEVSYYNWICDEAGLLDQETRQTIQDYNTAWNKQYYAVVAVAAVDDIRGWSSEDYARELGARWGLGANDMLLLLVKGGDWYVACGDNLADLMTDTQQTRLKTALDTPYYAGDYSQAAVDFFRQSDVVLAQTLGRSSTGGQSPAPGQRWQEPAGASGVSIAGVVLLILGQIFLEPLALLLGSTETILPYACDYLRIILLGAPYMTASFVLNNQLRFQGSAAYGMVGIAAGAVLNVGLDPLLIFGLNMGVAGAALATILSQLASFCMLLLGCARGGNLRIRLKNVCFRRDLFLEIGKGGLPSLCRQGLASIATICLNRSAGLYGDAAIAAMSVVSRAMMLAQSALIGFGQGFQPVCGFNYGAGLYHRVKEGFRFCVKWSTVFLTAVSVLGLVLAPQIIAVFRNDPEVIAFGARALRLQCLAFPLCGVIVISSMLTQTINKVWQASVLAVARQGLFFIPAVLALPHIWGELGVQLAQPVSDVCAFALTVPLVLGVLRDMDRQQRLEKIR